MVALSLRVVARNGGKLVEGVFNETWARPHLAEAGRDHLISPSVAADGARIDAVVGLGLGGPVFRGGHAKALGAPAWGPPALLRDLELRLGLPPLREDDGSRLPKWTARIKSVGDPDAFYMQSFGVDELGTAAALLDWRDTLVEAGWDGSRVTGGGPRLDALARIEQYTSGAIPLGVGDRLARVERALAAIPREFAKKIYGRLALVEPMSLWPGRWRCIFALLEELGTRVERASLDLKAAPRESDLGILQSRLRGERTDAMLRGDGTLLVLRGNTLSDLGEPIASTLAQGRRIGSVDVVVRCRNPECLETALAVHGLPLQGSTSRSVWRPAMQVLPLAVELAFEPRDPYRLLELLTLPVGPFRGVLGARLARAVSRQPGVGGKEWHLQKEDAKKRLLERHRKMELERGLSEVDADRVAGNVVARRFAELAEWLEAKAATGDVIDRDALLTVIARVRAWLKGRLRGDDRDTYFAAAAQALIFEGVVGNDSRTRLTREEVRQLLDRYAKSEQPCAVTIGAAGRTAHVDHPGSILSSCDRVILWSFVGGTERRPARLPWTSDERSALEATGAHLPDPTDLLAAEADAWRRAILAATSHVVLVVPRTASAVAAADHPLWDEIRARLALSDETIDQITLDVSRVMGRGQRSQRLRVTEHPPLGLPEARAKWHLPPNALRSASAPETTSVSELEASVTCPLAWVFQHRAVLRSGGLSKVAEGSLLSGMLGHRLVEQLYSEGAFELEEGAFASRASACFEALVRAEGATLLLPGASIERMQLDRQLQHAMRELHRYLARTERRITSVEEPVSTHSAIGPLHGRLDLRLSDREGHEAILDLKWGSSKYQDLLREGRAVQLAVYSRAIARSGANEAPPAGYFSLSTGRVLASDERMAPTRNVAGPSLQATLAQAEATAVAVRALADRGVLPVVGTKRSVPLLESLGVPEASRHRHVQASREAPCAYCEYGALCGRNWEGLR